MSEHENDDELSEPAAERQTPRDDDGPPPVRENEPGSMGGDNGGG